MRIASLYRYLVKGLSPESQSDVALQADAYWPGDRLFAFENGPSGFDPTAPAHEPKIKFLMLMRNGSLARLRTCYHDDSYEISIAYEGQEVARGDVRTPEGRQQLEAFFATYCRDELRGLPKLLAAPEGHRFTDSRKGFVSLINLASVAALEQCVGEALDPLRFRGNVYVEGLEANAELEWPTGTMLTASNGVVFEVLKRIDRCAATNVDPVTGLRETQIPKALMSALGHIDCGVYLRIAKGGVFSLGEELALS